MNRIRILQKPIIIDVYICDACKTEHRDISSIVKCKGCMNEGCISCTKLIGMAGNMEVRTHINDKYCQVIMDNEKVIK